jgi:hypothetical protein
MKCTFAQVPMNPNCFLDHTAIKGLLASIPKEDLTCLNCEDVVMIREKVSPGVPFDRAAIVGCERMIEGVIERVIDEGLNQGLDFAHCFENKKSRKSAGVSH